MLTDLGKGFLANIVKHLKSRRSFTIPRTLESSDTVLEQKRLKVQDGSTGPRDEAPKDT